MYRIFIIIGILMIVFAFSGKAQDQFFPEIEIHPKQTTILPNINGNLLYENNYGEKIKELHKQLILLEMQRNVDQAQKICENYCLNYHNYKKYRKCMLIFNK